MLNPLQKAIVVPAVLAFVLFAGRGEADEAPRNVVSESENAGILVGREIGAVGVTLDFAKILTFKQPARTIIIGNPGIVDGTLSDENTIVLTGKAIGTTNMIVLGEGGQEIANFTVNVGANTRQLTTIYHGTTLQTFSCAGPCRPVEEKPAASPAPPAPAPAGGSQ